MNKTWDIEKWQPLPVASPLASVEEPTVPSWIQAQSSVVIKHFLGNRHCRHDIQIHRGGRRDGPAVQTAITPH